MLNFGIIVPLGVQSFCSDRKCRDFVWLFYNGLALSISVFLFFPVCLRWICLKTKSKDAKDKEKLSRHQFVPGTFSGVLQCLVCDKTLLGKESLQCPSKFLGLVCVIFVLCLPRQWGPWDWGHRSACSRGLLFWCCTHGSATCQALTRDGSHQYFSSTASQNPELCTSLPT